MKNVYVIGMDVHKINTELVFLDIRGKMLGHKRMKTDSVILYFSNYKKIKIGMEVTIGSQYLGKQLIKMGHDVKVIPAKRISGFYVGPKNDIRDAQAIAKATLMDFINGIELKSEQALIVQGYLRHRELVIKTRVSLCNQIRGILAELGIKCNRGKKALFEKIESLLNDPDCSKSLKDLLQISYDNIKYQVKLECEWNLKLKEIAKKNDTVKLLTSIPGFGVLNAIAFIISIGNLSKFKTARDVSAFIGLVPKQNSSGEKKRLGRITKKGATYTRSLLIHGGRAFLHNGKKDDKNHIWLSKIAFKRGQCKASVAWANKMARIAFAVMRDQKLYNRILEKKVA